MAVVSEKQDADVHNGTKPDAKYESSSSSVSEAASINEKALLRKLDSRLLPPLTILYLLSFLDRSNVGNARLEGMTDDIKMCTLEFFAMKNR